MKTLLVLAIALGTTLGASDSFAAGGCGRGWHRGPYGHCVRNYMRPNRHACPRGFYLNRYGRCPRQRPLTFLTRGSRTGCAG